MQPKRSQRNRTTLNLIVDSGIFVAFLVAMAPRFSSVAIHEWLSIAFGAAIITHLLLHWHWLAEVTQRLFHSASASARVNYALNALLFVAMTIAIFSGVMISEAALPALGVTVARTRLWHSLHELSANGCLLLVGVHIALHWPWIVGAVKRVASRGVRLRAQGAAQQPEQELTA